MAKKVLEFDKNTAKVYVELIRNIFTDIISQYMKYYMFSHLYHPDLERCQTFHCILACLSGFGSTQAKLCLCMPFRVSKYPKQEPTTTYMSIKAY